MASMSKTRLSYFLRNLVLSALVLAGAVSAFRVLIKPHMQFLSSMKESKRAMNQYVLKHTDLMRIVETKRTHLKQLQAEFAETNAALFTTVEADEFFSDLQAISQEEGCMQDSLTVLQTGSAPRASLPDQDSYITVRRAEWSIVGRYRNIAALMNRFQDNSRRIWIDSPEIKPTSDPDVLDCEAVITLYVIHNKEERSNE